MIPLLRRLHHPPILVGSLIGGALALMLAGLYLLVG